MVDLRVKSSCRTVQYEGKFAWWNFLRNEFYIVLLYVRCRQNCSESYYIVVVSMLFSGGTIVKWSPGSSSHGHWLEEFFEVLLISHFHNFKIYRLLHNWKENWDQKNNNNILIFKIISYLEQISNWFCWKKAAETIMLLHVDHVVLWNFIRYSFSVFLKMTRLINISVCHNYPIASILNVPKFLNYAYKYSIFLLIFVMNNAILFISSQY